MNERRCILGTNPIQQFVDLQRVSASEGFTATVRLMAVAAKSTLYSGSEAQEEYLV